MSDESSKGKQPPQRTVVVVLDDDPECLDASRAELESAGFLVETHETISGLLRDKKRTQTAAFVVDLELAGESGIDAIRELHRRHPDLPVVCLTAHAAENYVFGALRAGAVGYVLKHDGTRRLPEVVREAMHGGAPMTASIARRVLMSLRGDAPRTPPAAAPATAKPVDAELTEREVDVLSALSRGLTYGECAGVLGISIDTVRSHVRNTYTKLHAASKAEAVSHAMRRGWID